MDITSLVETIGNNIVQFQPTIQGVVSAVLTTLFLRKNTNISEFEKMKAGKYSEALDDLLENGKITYFELYKCQNFLKIAKIADEYHQEKQEEESKFFDFDWFMRFYDIVGNISDGEMQALWARILAGELHQKGTYSLQLLDILKNFTQKQAELVNRVCSHCFMSEDKAFIPNDQEYSKFVGITYQDILDLDGLGLMNSSGIISLSANVKPDRPFALINNQLRMVVKCSGQENTEKEFNF